MAGGAAGSRSSRRQHHQHQHNAGTAPLLLLPPAPSPEDGARLVGSVHGLLPAGPLGPRFTLSATTGRAVLVVGGPLQSGSVKQEGEHAGADDNDASRKDKNNKADVEVDVGWLVGVLPSYLLTLITSRSPSSAVDRRAVIKGVEVLNALVASAGEVPSIAQTLATSASAFVDLLLCLLVWHVADYCEDQPRAADGEQKRDGVQDDAAPPPSPATDTASEVPAPATARCANGERSTAVGQAAATLSFALKAELLHPRPDGWEEGGFVDQPLLDAVLGHDKLDDIISAFIDSLRVLLHHYQHAPSPAVAEEICGVVEALYLLCFSDDFAGRLMGHRLFSEGHVLLALAQVLALPSAGEAMLASGLGLLAILCEKQQPEFLAIAHHQPPIHAIINTLLSLATSYLQKLGLQGKAEEEEGGGYAVASPAQAYADATYRRIFHCIELFADHPRYKAAIIRPGAEVLWCFLSLPTDAFGAFLKDPNRRAITVHLLHLLISLALPCPTASWEDITGGRAAQQGPALLVTALRDFCFSASPAQDREQAGERMVANLERVVGALYEADNIHFPVEHFLALHTLTAALHASLTATTLPAASTATATTTTAQTEDATSDSTAPPSATIAHQHAADPDEQAKQQQSEQVVKREEMEVNDEQTHREPDKQPHRAEEEGQAQHGQDKADGAVKEEDAEMLMAGEKKKKKEEPEKKETTIVEEGDEPRGEKRGREDVVSRPAADVDGGDDGTTTTTSNSARNEALPDDQQANGNSSDASNKMDEETTASAQQLQVEEMEEDEKEEGPSQKKLKLGHNAPAPNELPDDQQQQQQPNDQGQGEATPSDDHAPDTTTTTTNTE